MKRAPFQNLFFFLNSTLGAGWKPVNFRLTNRSELQGSYGFLLELISTSGLYLAFAWVAIAAVRQQISLGDMTMSLGIQFLDDWWFTKVFCFKKMTGWWFQTFFMFPPILGDMIQFDEHIFQMGWNHQLDDLNFHFLLYKKYLFGVKLYTRQRNDTSESFAKSTWAIFSICCHTVCYVCCLFFSHWGIYWSSKRDNKHFQQFCARSVACMPTICTFPISTNSWITRLQ